MEFRGFTGVVREGVGATHFFGATGILGGRKTNKWVYFMG